MVLLGGGVPKKDFPRKHDVILRYSKGSSWSFNKEFKPYKENTQEVGIHSTLSGENNEIDLERGTPVTDWWTDIRTVTGWHPERTGYPTQKPLALLDRIIKASSNRGDLVLDPFCGCGTAMVSASNLRRKYAGMDISSFACQTVMKERFNKAGIECKIEGVPKDLEAAKDMWRNSPFKFEEWAVSQIEGLAPNTKQIGDGGIDGRGKIVGKMDVGNGLVLCQVKGGEKVTMDQVKAFKDVLNTTNATAGIFVTMVGSEITSGMKKEAVSLGQYQLRDSVSKYPRLQFWSVKDMFRSDVHPRLPAMYNPMTGKEFKPSLWA